MMKLLIGVRWLRGVAVAMNKKFKSCKSVPKCFVDGKPCYYGGNCSISRFGILAKDGKEEVLWVCPRLHDKNVLDDIEKKYLKKRG